MNKARAWLKQNEEITPLAEDFIAAVTIKAAARKNGSVLQLPDCLIAAIAIRLDRPVVTRNTEDFRAIQAAGVLLTLENWRDE